MSKTLITCNCGGSFDIDTAALSGATGLAVKPACSALCTGDIAKAAAAIEDGETIFCCTQEGRVFADLAAELDRDDPPLLDLRDRAGWSEDPAPKLPKMSALMAEAMLPARGAKTRDVISEGLCLILGPSKTALPAAAQLAPFLSVTVLLDPSDQPDSPALVRDFDVIQGRLRSATGAFGGFDVQIDALAELDPSGRGEMRFTAPQDGANSQCDIILDLTGAPALFPAPQKREGYLRADPAHAPSVAAAVMAASHMVGTFEKPLYVATQPLLCAHSRAQKTGCSNCLNLCPTGAITPDGDHVSIDPMICAGCGACAAACPSGAISYDAPPNDEVLLRLSTLAGTYRAAADHAPRLLVHDSHGHDMIALTARFGRGLPADVIPMQLDALGAFGHAEILAALAAGFATVTLLPGPGVERPALGDQIELATAIAGTGKVTLLDTTDPDAMADELYSGAGGTGLDNPLRPMGPRRQVTRLAAGTLNPSTDIIPLPQGAPYGAVLVNTDSCTLCLSCVSLCPSGALGDNPDKPQLLFQEDACLQCGLCANICPEQAITLQPQLNLTPAALSQQVLNEEEPFPCIECGALFGSKSTVERITEKLRDHAMFGSDDKLKMIQMCDDCRVKAQMHAQDNPFAIGKRPRPRTTDDYLSKRRDH